MTTATTKTAAGPFLRGTRDGAPFLLVVGPFALLFGVAASEAGLGLAEIMGFSVLVIAGASQFTALQLMQEAAPVPVILAAALAVNLRMAMYSAALVPHLGAAPLWLRAVMAYFLVDQSYALAEIEYRRRPEAPLAAKIAYFFGVILPVCPAWYALTLVGARAGSAMPEGWGLDFAVPITFLALVSPMLLKVPHMIAALTSAILALALSGLPSGFGLLLAAFAAMAAGASAEIWLERDG